MSYRSLRTNRDFTLLWSGEAVNQLGTGAALFVIPLLGYALTGSAGLAALGDAAYLLGMTCALLPAGLAADRLNRRRIMLTSAVATLVVTAAIGILALTGYLTFPVLLIGVFVAGLAAGLFKPAETAAVQALVATEDLPTAMSQNNARQHVASLTGGPLGAILYSFSLAAPFLVNALTQLVSIASLLLIQRDLAAPTSSAVPGKPWRDMAEGFRYLRQHPVFGPLLAYASLSNLMVNAVFSIAVLRMISAGTAPGAIAAVEVCAGIGGIIGAALAPSIIDRMPTGGLTIASAWSWIPLAIPLAFTASPWVIGACVALGLLLNPAGNAAMASYRVATTPPSLIGRTTSVMQFGSFVTMPLSPLLAGLLLEFLGARIAVLSLAGCVAGTALIPTMTRELRSIGRPQGWQPAFH